MTAETIERGACSVPDCPEPKGSYRDGYPQSMCAEHTREFDRFRHELARRTGSSRGAARLFYESVGEQS